MCAVALDDAERNVIVVRDDVSRKMRKIPVGRRFFPVGPGRLEHLEAGRPVVAVVIIAGELFADDYVRGDRAIHEPMLPAGDDGPDGRRHEGGLFKEREGYFNMRSRPPRVGDGGEEDEDKA